MLTVYPNKIYSQKQNKKYFTRFKKKLQVKIYKYKL